MKNGFRAEFVTGYLQIAKILHNATVSGGIDESQYRKKEQNGATVAVTGFGVGRLVKVAPGNNGTVTITKPTTGVGTITASTNKSTFDAAVAAGVGDATHIIAQSDNSVRNTIDEYIPTDKYSTVYDGIVADDATGKAVAVYPIINDDDIKLVQIGETPTA